MSDLPLFAFAASERELAREHPAFAVRDVERRKPAAGSAVKAPSALSPRWDTPRRARSSPPETSRAARQRVAGDGTLGAQQLAVLALVRAYPGRTATQLAALSCPGSETLGSDETQRRYRISRRMPELVRVGLVRSERSEEAREQRWFPQPPRSA